MNALFIIERNKPMADKTAKDNDDKTMNDADKTPTSVIGPAPNSPHGLSQAQREVLPNPTKTSRQVQLLAVCNRAGAAGEEGEVINVEPSPDIDRLVAQGAMKYV